MKRENEQQLYHERREKTKIFLSSIKEIFLRNEEWFYFTLYLKVIKTLVLHLFKILSPIIIKIGPYIETNIIF